MCYDARLLSPHHWCTFPGSDCGLRPQVDDAEAALELCELAAALLRSPLARQQRWGKERALLLLQLLRVSQRCLDLGGDCRPSVGLMQQLLPLCGHVRCSFLSFAVAALAMTEVLAISLSFRSCPWMSW